MPIVHSSQYQPPFWLRSDHLETMLPHLLRREKVDFQRERISTPDNDFLDLDWFGPESNRLMILCHGLEGRSTSQYMQGACRMMSQHNWKALALNFRSCSGEINRQKRMYHHGDTSDLSFVIDTILQKDQYSTIVLAGFSLGGNVVLKYLGTTVVPSVVKAAIAVSVPCHLASSAAALDDLENRIYSRRFRRSLWKKFKAKNKQFPGYLPLDQWNTCRTWYDFDNTFTTIINGFESADQYYEQGSAGNFLAPINKPALIINAKNDPFLKAQSYPSPMAADHPFVHLEMPDRGGHVGFWYPGRKWSYAEERILAFAELHTSATVLS